MSAQQKKIRTVTDRGFTLIEILVVIGIIAILAAVVIIAINPARQFAQARDSQRTANINAILNAIGQRIADNKGVFAGEVSSGKFCPTLPVATTTINTTIDTTAITSANLGCLVPTYISVLPSDPSSPATPSTGYALYTDTNGRVHVVAETPEPSIPRDDPIEVSR